MIWIAVSIFIAAVAGIVLTALFVKKRKTVKIIAVVLFSVIAAAMAAYCALTFLFVYSVENENLPVTETETKSVITSDELPADTEYNEYGAYIGLELNQGLSFGVDDDGELYPMTNFAAGKTTAVIARYSGYAEEPDGYTLEVKNDSVHTTTLKGERSGDGTGIVFTVSADILKTPGNYTFCLNGKTSDSVSGYFAETRTLKLLMVPIRGNYGGTVTEPAEGWQKYDGHLRACYPIAEDHVITEIGEMIDLSDIKYDLYTTEGQWEVWSELKQLQSYNDDGYDLILGFVCGQMGELQNIGGFTYGLPANIINADLPCAAAVVSHEVAHCFLVGDEYEGGAYNLDINDAPYGYSGEFWYNREEIVTAENPTVSKAFDYNLWCSGSAVLEKQIPFDISNGRLMSNVASIMCGCDETTDNYWISSDIWEQLYTAFGA